MKRTILMTILATSIALGASHASTSTVTNTAQDHSRVAPGSEPGGEGMKAAKDSARAPDAGSVEFARKCGTGKAAAVGGNWTMRSLRQDLSCACIGEGGKHFIRPEFNQRA
jgi:hypothetical protein